MGLYCRWVDGWRWMKESEGAGRTRVVDDECAKVWDAQVRFRDHRQKQGRLSNPPQRRATSSQ
jgi:hypothetical protein